MSQQSKTCPGCDVTFSCGAGTGTCWCCDYPAIMPLEDQCGCYCPSCLTKLIAHKIKTFVASSSLDEAVNMARNYAQAGPLREGIDYDFEEGDMVFTQWYHLKRGSCCGNGCRNCPFGHRACPGGAGN